METSDQNLLRQIDNMKLEIKAHTVTPQLISPLRTISAFYIDDDV